MRTWDYVCGFCILIKNRIEYLLLWRFCPEHNTYRICRYIHIHIHTSNVIDPSVFEWRMGCLILWNHSTTFQINLKHSSHLFAPQKRFNLFSWCGSTSRLQLCGVQAKEYVSLVDTDTRISNTAFYVSHLCLPGVNHNYVILSTILSYDHQTAVLSSRRPVQAVMLFLYFCDKHCTWMKGEWWHVEFKTLFALRIESRQMSEFCLLAIIFVFFAYI